VPTEALLFVLLLVTAIVIVRLRDLFAAAMLTGIFSLLSAGLFTLMDAVDVAFTEAAVGAGVSTIVMLSALSLTGSRENQQPVRLLPIVVVLVMGATLFYGSLDMPRYGDPGAPVHGHVAPEYSEGSRALHIPNVVTTVLGSYRGYDTFGETTVVFVAAIGVLLLLWRRRRTAPGADFDATGVSADAFEAFPGSRVVREGRSPMRMREKIILRVAGKGLIPFFFLFALYVQFHGDFGPGGGFQAGVIASAGLVLYGLIFGLDAVKKVVPRWVVEVGTAVGVLIWAGVGVWSMLEGGNFLAYGQLFGDFAHGQHYGIMLIEAGVLCTVSCGMTLIYYVMAGRADS
jgi:multicomponent Na+:H+ antiporter subunit B